MWPNFASKLTSFLSEITRKSMVIGGIEVNSLKILLILGAKFGDDLLREYYVVNVRACCKKLEKAKFCVLFELVTACNLLAKFNI